MPEVSHLSKWITNRVLSSIPKADRAKEVKDLNLNRNRLPTERALRVQWCVEDDNFTFSVIYDPLGFLAPFTLPTKLLWLG